MRQAGDATLLALNDQLQRVKRWAARLKRKIDRGPQAWQRWSTSVDEALNLAGQISRTPASDLGGVSVKLDAVIWLLVHDNAILDTRAERRLRALGREVRALADR